MEAEVTKQMRKVWLNDGQPDEDGIITLQIINTQGHVVSTFKGTSKDEIADQLADAQVNANRRLGQLLGKPDKANPPQPAPYTAEERLKYANGVADPSAVVETVTEIANRQQQTQADRDAYYQAEALAFTREHPEFYRTLKNQQRLFKALEENQYDLTRHNLALVFEELLAEGELELPPASDGAPPEGAEGASTPPVEAQPQQRNYSTGLRNSDASASRPAPPKKKPLVTWETLEKMPRHEYNERLRDPEFRRAVDALPQRVGAR
jgi:hypothetical protein